LSYLIDLYQQYLRLHYRPPSGAIVPTLVAGRFGDPELHGMFNSLDAAGGSTRPGSS
jgi:hypothetical protein